MWMPQSLPLSFSLTQLKSLPPLPFRYDPHLGTSTLTTEWISQASVRQRQGRAGRTKAGVAFHLMSKRRHASLRPFLDSELLRTPLEELCLLAKR
jgi:HrpA-like RNA helicase